MSGLLRIVAALGVALKAVETRNWLGLGASVALHLAVLLGWKPEPPPEPQPISFEIALEPPSAKPLPEAKKRVASKKTQVHKLAKQRKAQKLAKQSKPKLQHKPPEPHVLVADWQGETRASKDAPALVLPDAHALGLPTGAPATSPTTSQANGKPALTRAAVSVANTPSAAAGETGAGLSEPGSGQVSADNAPRGEPGLALAATASLAANQGLNPGIGGAGAQANTAAVSLAAGSGRGGASAGGLQASAAPQAALNAAPGSGVQVAVAAATALAAPAGGETQGVRLAASGSLASLPAAALAGTGSIAAGPPAAALSQGGLPNAPTGGAAIGAAGGALATSQASSAVNPVTAGGRAGSMPAGVVEAGATRAGHGRESAGRLGGTALAPTALVGAARNVSVPGRTGQNAESLALAPGEPGSSPSFAVALQPVLANSPGTNPYLPARPGRTAGASGELAVNARFAMPGATSRAAPDAGGKAGASTQFAGSAAGGGIASASGAAPASGGSGGILAAPGQSAASAVLNAAREAGRAPVVLSSTQVVPVNVVRPDTEIQRLDVLAPSNYCPLPLPGHTQPDNRAPKPDRHITEQPAYSLDNPRIDYPFLANIRGVEGRVTVRVEVLADGHPGKMWLKQSSGSGILDQDAQTQLRHWRFVPARINGQPVPAWIDVPVMYRLSEARP